jgi:Flp pilus assembly protein TadG
LAYLDDKGNLVAIGNAPTADVSAGPEAKDVTIGDNDIALYFKAGTDTSKDGLYLLIGKTFNALPDATTLYAVDADDATKLADVVTNVNVSIDGVQVTRTFSATLKSEYSKRTIIGVLSNGTTYTLQSEKFDEMYEKTPKDAVLEFALNKDQSDVVAKLIKDGKLTFTGNVIKLDPVVDLTTPLTVKVDVIDATDADNKKTYKTEEWKIQSPISYTGSVSGKFTVKDPTLATNDKISILGNKDLKPAWKSVVVTGVKGEKILTFTEGSTYNFTKAYTSYTTVETKGLQFEISKDEKDFSIDAETGTLTWLEEPTGSVYEHTVTVTVKLYHDWGTITLGSYTVTVSREKE